MGEDDPQVYPKPRILDESQDCSTVPRILGVFSTSGTQGVGFLLLQSDEKKRPDPEPKNLAAVVFGKAQQIADDMAALMNLTEWEDILGAAPTDRRRSWRGIFQLITRMCANYERRIVFRVRSFPARLV